MALFLTALIVPSTAECQAADPAATTAAATIERDLDAAVARAAREGRPVFIHFTAEWCLPCKELRARVFPEPQVAGRLARFVRAEVDIESPDGDRAARRYGVQTVPVLILLSPHGEELRSLRVVGERGASELAAILDKAIERSGLDRRAVPAATQTPPQH